MYHCFVTIKFAFEFVIKLIFVYHLRIKKFNLNSLVITVMTAAKVVNINRRYIPFISFWVDIFC